MRLTKNKLRQIIKEALSAENLDKLVLLLWNPDPNVRRNQAQSLMQALGITEQQILEYVLSDVTFEFSTPDYFYVIFKKPFGYSDMTSLDDEEISEYGKWGDFYRLAIDLSFDEGREGLALYLNLALSFEKQIFNDLDDSDMPRPEFIFYKDFIEYLINRIAKEPFADKVL